MGKRSDFPRRPHDDYQTPYKPVLPLLPHLGDIYTFAEPCCGEGHLVEHLERHRLRCVFRGDIRDGTGFDALTMPSAWFKGLHADVIITNPPWTRQILHPLIAHFMTLAPTWLLFDSDWAHNQHAGNLLRHCVKIVSVGRVKWFEHSKKESKDNCCWYLFDHRHVAGPMFVGREQQQEAA